MPHRMLMQAAMSKAGRISSLERIPLSRWLGGGALALTSFTAAWLIQPPAASAVPAYARQTGQPCATCHTAFPELTPYGRQFKLTGYTAGG
ncbi:MAG: hypothetical protein ACLPIX_05815, partial [Rhodomicrobium sp.]